MLRFLPHRIGSSWALGLGHRGGRKEEGKGERKAERSNDDVSTYMSCPMLDVSWNTWEFLLTGGDPRNMELLWSSGFSVGGGLDLGS